MVLVEPETARPGHTEAESFISSVIGRAKDEQVAS